MYIKFFVRIIFKILNAKNRDNRLHGNNKAMEGTCRLSQCLAKVC